VSPLLETSVPAVFAGGDSITKRYRQITTAVADGTVPALNDIDNLCTDGERHTVEELSHISSESNLLLFRLNILTHTLPAGKQTRRQCQNGGDVQFSQLRLQSYIERVLATPDEESHTPLFAGSLDCIPEFLDGMYRLPVHLFDQVVSL
jgi:hypothetical protein